MTEHATSPLPAQNAKRPLSPRLQPWARELSVLLKIGAPLALTQLVQFSINAIDLLMIGKLGPEALAGASLGLVVFYTTWLFYFGPTMATSPLISQSLGADKDNVEDVRRSVRMGLWVLALGFPAAYLIYMLTEPITLALGQPPELAARAAPYVLTLGLGLPFTMGAMMLRNFLAAIERTRVPLLIIASTTVINAGLNYVLIYGHFGVPRLELVGAGLASALSNAAGFFALAAYVKWEREARRFNLFQDLFVPHWERFREVLQLGWPIGVTSAFEGMLFNACILLMGRIGTNEVAAYQVALNVSALAFMLPLGISMAGSVRVGLAAGAQDMHRVRRAIALTILVSIVAIMMIALPVLIFPRTVAGFYLDASDAANLEVIAMVATFLPIASAFALFDAIQVAASQCLRGLKDVRIPMILTGVSYWLIGFPMAAGLGLYTRVGAVGVWWGLLTALGIAAALQGARLWLLTRVRA